MSSISPVGAPAGPPPVAATKAAAVDTDSDSTAPARTDSATISSQGQDLLSADLDHDGDSH